MYLTTYIETNHVCHQRRSSSVLVASVLQARILHGAISAAFLHPGSASSRLIANCPVLTLWHSGWDHRLVVFACDMHGKHRLEYSFNVIGYIYMSKHAICEHFHCASFLNAGIPFFLPQPQTLLFRSGTINSHTIVVIHAPRVSSTTLFR
jgi:hypothetical protein